MEVLDAISMSLADYKNTITALLIRSTLRCFLPSMVLLSELPVNAQFTYATNDNSITVTSYTATGGRVVIPGTVDGMPVTRIGQQAFYRTAVLDVTIPESVTTIAQDAFYLCYALTNISFGSGLRTIGTSAFHSCYSLPAVNIPSNVTAIGAEAFADCGALQSITVDDANPNYAAFDGVLFDKAGQTLLQFPEGVEGHYQVPDGVLTITPRSFENCSKLLSVEMPSSVMTIGDNAFASCSSLITISLSSNLADLADYAFLNCTSLAGIDIPGGVTSIGDWSFFYCTNLGTVRLGHGVGRVGENAFFRCYALTNLALPDTLLDIANGAFLSCHELPRVSIPQSCTNIGDTAFANALSLTNVVIGDRVTHIGDYAFYFCPDLASASMGRSVASIGEQAFRFANLTALSFPGSVRRIDEGAFWDCTNLTSAYFEGAAPSSANYIFENVTTVYYPPGAAGWGSSFGRTRAIPWEVHNDLQLLPTGKGVLNVQGPPESAFILEASGDLSQRLWNPLATNTFVNGRAKFVEDVNYPRRFYRLRSP
jgi:hypothetical protein